MTTIKRFNLSNINAAIVWKDQLKSACHLGVYLGGPRPFVCAWVSWTFSLSTRWNGTWLILIQRWKFLLKVDMTMNRSVRTKLLHTMAKPYKVVEVWRVLKPAPKYGKSPNDRFFQIQSFSKPLSGSLNLRRFLSLSVCWFEWMFHYAAVVCHDRP